MLAYCLNMDSATDRWEYSRTNFLKEGIHLERVSAVVGRNLAFPIPEYDAKAYERWHGKRTVPSEVGCYLSHLKAMDMFLQTNEPFALICEDDVNPEPGCAAILERSLEYRDSWDILRLSGHHRSMPFPVIKLDQVSSLSVTLLYTGGAAAYVLNRKAAEVLKEKLLPMFLPYDHALDREWMWGLRSLTVHPRPIDQNQVIYPSQIVHDPYRLAWSQRIWTVVPFRAKVQISRFLHRSLQIIRHKFGRARLLPSHD